MTGKELRQALRVEIRRCRGYLKKVDRPESEREKFTVALMRAEVKMAVDLYNNKNSSEGRMYSILSKLRGYTFES